MGEVTAFSKPGADLLGNRRSDDRGVRRSRTGDGYDQQDPFENVGDGILGGLINPFRLHRHALALRPLDRPGCRTGIRPSDPDNKACFINS
jgi:hypothetical protein